MDIRTFVSPKKLLRVFYKRGAQTTIYGEVYEHTFSYFGGEQVHIRHLIQKPDGIFIRFAEDAKGTGKSTFLVASHSDFPVGTLVEVVAEERTHIYDRLFNEQHEALYVISQKPIVGTIREPLKENESSYVWGEN